MKEIAVAKTGDLQNGQMRQITIGDSQILLSKINDRFYAVSAFCTHNGAPLEKGILSGENIVCPWHNACFNAIAGQQLEPPGLDSLTAFNTRVEGDQILVKLPDEILPQRTLEMAQYIPECDRRTLVILGGGIAGINAVEVLRQKGYQGKIILISGESQLPYDRTKLTKNYLQGKADQDALTLRNREFYDEHDIELCLGQVVTKVDGLKKTLTFSDDSTLEFDSLLLATGGSPRRLDVPGADLANIFTIRQPGDVDSILATAKDAKQALVIGSSFIGMEAVASLTQQGLAVTVISPRDVPFKKTLGDKLGKMFQNIHEKQGVTFNFGTKVTKFIGEEGVKQAVLENGDHIATDLVIVGIGVEPNTSYLEGIDLHEKDHSIPVNKYLQTEIEDIYAAGDIARFPYAPLGKSTRIEHWRLAAQQGRIAAANMMGKKRLQSVDEIVPFFWSGQYDFKLRYVGHAEQWDEVYIDGDLEQPEFLAFYYQDTQIMAVAGINRDRDLAAISELMRQQKMPNATTVKEQKIDWASEISY
ncbi:MAG: FAD-dependent oxidoreductase [Cyanobacteria bacterium P01_A01_bin.40]